VAVIVMYSPGFTAPIPAIVPVKKLPADTAVLPR
jgi:hypothetical protein